MELSFGCEAILEGGEVVKLLGGEISSSIYKEDKCELYYLYDWQHGKSDAHMWCAKKDLEIIGHPIHLEHWLRVLAINKDGEIDVHSSKHLGEAHIAGISLYVQPDPDEDFIKFNLLTGQPTDYEALAPLLGLSE